MMIHDFDMARFLAGREVTQVYAKAYCHDPEIQKAGDVDTAVCILTFDDGTIASIENSRFAPYGYDQRIEVLGAHGNVSSANRHQNEVTLSTKDAVLRDPPLNFFLERYMDAYVAEMKSFVEACTEGSDVEVGIVDGQEALRLAYAAKLSMEQDRPVYMEHLEIN